jgi:hypothetical protein
VSDTDNTFRAVWNASTEEKSQRSLDVPRQLSDWATPKHNATDCCVATIGKCKLWNGFHGYCGLWLSVEPAFRVWIGSTRSNPVPILDAKPAFDSATRPKVARYKSVATRFPPTCRPRVSISVILERLAEAKLCRAASVDFGEVRLSTAFLASSDS